MAPLTRENKRCSVDGCEGVHLASGFCKLHYYRQYRRGYTDGVVNELERQFSSLSIVQLAYAAGFIDADGSIMLSIENKKYIKPRIAALGIDREPLEFLSAMFGGKPYIVKRKQPASYHQAWAWSIQGARAIAAARVLMPYLVIKSVQAYLLSCFELEAKWSKGGNSRNIATPDSETLRRTALLQEMRYWNDRTYLREKKCLTDFEVCATGYPSISGGYVQSSG
jgi:hypothetical protein